MLYKTIEDIDLTGKKIFMRVDFNVPIKNGSIASTKRIEASLKSVKYVVDKGVKLILASHLGRPKGKVVKDLRMRPVAKVLKKLMGKKVVYVNDCVGPKVQEAIKKMSNGGILLLENLRFHQGEEENDLKFVEQLAQFVDVYVLDGFAAAHREHASTFGLPMYLKKQGKDVVAGYLMKQELDYWGPIARGETGGVVVIGGAKLKEKMKAAEKFPGKFDKVVVAGVVGNVFLKAANYKIGNSKYDEKGKDFTDKAKGILNKHKNIVLPVRVVLDDNSKIKIADGVPSGKSIADTLLEDNSLEFIKSAPRVVIFGTMGRYEDGFTKGTDQLVEILTNYRGILKIGGGDAEKALKGKIDVPISTGGGASIEFIIKGTLPGLEALKVR